MIRLYMSCQLFTYIYSSYNCKPSTSSYVCLCHDTISLSATGIGLVEVQPMVRGYNRQVASDEGDLYIGVGLGSWSKPRTGKCMGSNED